MEKWNKQPRLVPAHRQAEYTDIGHYNYYVDIFCPNYNILIDLTRTSIYRLEAKVLTSDDVVPRIKALENLAWIFPYQLWPIRYYEDNENDS